LSKRGYTTIPPLIIKGCEDHILNLMSHDFEQSLVANCPPHLVVNGKHRATDVVQFLISKVLVLCFFYIIILFFIIYISCCRSRGANEFIDIT
jgi:hypothetical protein